MDKVRLAQMLDHGWSYERIGREVGLDPSTVSYWARKHGLRSRHTDRHLARGGLPREGLAAAVAEGYSTRQIAEMFGVSQSTVRHWLQEFGFTTAAAELRRERREGSRDRQRIRTLRCRRHGLTEFRLENRGSYRCLLCRSENVASHRRRQKATLVAEAGGRCQLCGYDRHVGALHFHHRDPATKSFNIAARGMTRSLEAARAEMKKCVLLCSNCHAEVEGGVHSL